MGIEDSDPKMPPRPLPELDISSPDGIPQIGQDDLVVRERKRLGDYVALLTQKNKYSIQAGSTLVDLKSPTGNPAPLTDPHSGVNNNFYDNYSNSADGQLAISKLNDSSKSGILETESPFYIKKGKSDMPYKTGEEYFAEIEEKLGDAEIPTRIEQALLANNRFNSSNPAFISGETESENSARRNLGSIIIQPDLGRHSPSKLYGEDSRPIDTISIEKLKNFGLITLLKASGEVVVPSDLSDPDAKTSAAVATIPGMARLGQRIPVTRFDGVSILSDASPTFEKHLRDENVAADAVPSYGNPYNPLAPFNSFGVGASKTSAAILSLTVTGLLKSLAITVNSIQRKRQTIKTASDAITSGFTSEDRREQIKNRLGSYLGKEDNDSIFDSIKESIDIDLAYTSNEYFDCLDAGIDEFFNFKGNNAGVKIINESANAFLNAGFYNVILRELLRSTTDLFVQQFYQKDLILNSKMDIDKNQSSGNIGSTIISNVIGFQQQLNNSKLLKFMNILAIIGDKVINNRLAQSGNNSLNSTFVDDINDTSLNDSFSSKPNVAVLHMKSMLDGKQKLAWGSNTLPSAYLISANVLEGNGIFDSANDRFSAYKFNDGYASDANTNRISNEHIQELEKYLEAQYVPFYFQDLRTNEIISFHAFIDSLSDSFDVQYEENEGYGRVGQVYTYKNTNRNISFTFNMVATSQDDFDEMWKKFNKLVTMLYPQWSEGRVLEYGNERFVQPFSQLPKSSPLIRIRIGDIIKSNYSDYAAARLFGIGNGTDSFNLNTADQQQADSIEATNSINQNITRLRNQYQNEFPVGAVVNIRPNLQQSTGRTGRRNQASSMIYEIAEVSSNIGTAQPVRRGTAATPRGATVSETQKVQILGLPEQNNNKYRIRFINPSSNADYNQQGVFLVDKENLSINEEELSQAAARSVTRNITSSSFSTNQELINNFFGQQNPIMKSFENVKGKGLAGFIKNLSYDVDQNTVWSTGEYNSRAPNMLKIAIAFSPVEDIQPGIDSNGMNVAPLYNVGKIMGKYSSNKGDTSYNNEKSSFTQNTEITWRTRNRDSV